MTPGPMDFRGPMGFRTEANPENFGGGDDKNFKHKTSKIRMCCNQAHSQKFAMERLI